MVDEFPGNSKRDKDAGKYQNVPKKTAVAKKDRDAPKPVVKTEAIVKKRGFGRRFKETFFGGEFHQARSYILMEVLLPAIRNMFVDATTKGMERLVYGETTRRRPVDPNRPRYSYNTPTSRYAPQPGPMLPGQPPLQDRRRQRDSTDIILTSRDDAEAVLEQLTEIISQFEVASLADLYALCNLPTSWTDNKWGWANLSYARVNQVREGYLLDLPPAEPI